MTAQAEIARSSLSLEAALRKRRDAGRKALIVYVTAGLPLAGGESWLDVARVAVGAGADAVEIGVPFSDPVMDGPVIQEASRRALVAGTTPRSILAEVAGSSGGGGSAPVARGAQEAIGAPVAVMTYYNLAHTFGLDRFAGELAAAGIAAAILPDLPLEEAGPWLAAAGPAGVETVMLAAPTTPDNRLEAICAASSGFVYGVGLMGVTGLRDSLAVSAIRMARRLKAVTDKPVLIGVGISDAAQAREACEVADGVVIGSAVMKCLLDGEGASGVAALVAGIRAAIDEG